MNEFLAAYETSKAKFTGGNLPKIPDGMYAVVIVSPAYCEYTDALLPVPYRSIHKMYGSRRIAEYIADKLIKEYIVDGCYPEVDVVVYPEVEIVRPSKYWTVDDIPF